MQSNSLRPPIPKPSVVWQLLRETARGWSEDQVGRLSAALAFYTVLSAAPLCILLVTVIGFVFGEDAARGRLAHELSEIVGTSAARGIQDLVNQAHRPEAGLRSGAFGLVVLLFGASGVFAELQSAMNAIWDVQTKPNRGLLGILRDRVSSFTMVMGVAFLLLVSLALSTLLAMLGAYFEQLLPGGGGLWQAVNFVFSLGIITLLFALIFKVIPDVEIGWRDVWPGALATALLFSLGKFALSMYLGRESVASPYGAAGSIVLLVIWVYYAAQILFIGAEFTQVYALHRGAMVRPSKNAVVVPGALRKSHSLVGASDGLER